MSKITPMLSQYLQIKGEVPDAILFFRMGDFYEMFFEDAITAAPILGIALTSRGTYQGKKVPMCGVPHHAAKTYIARLIDSGWKVAICEQIELPKQGRGIARREVTRVVTPGSIIDERDVDRRNNVYMAAVTGKAGRYGLAHADLTTGEFRVTEIEDWGELLDELGRIDPAELLVPESDISVDGQELGIYRQEILGKDFFDPARAEPLLLEQLGVQSLDGFGLQEMPQGIMAAGALVHYLRHTQKGNPQHIQQIVSYRLGDFMFLDEATRSHLELVKTMRRQSSEGSLLRVMDKTLTPMGCRLLRKWISYPLIESDEIQNRLAAVACFVEDPLFREQIRTNLREIYDLERLNGRIALGRANARDLLALRDSLLRLPGIKARLTPSPSALLSSLGERLGNFNDITELIGTSIHEEPPVSVKEGGMIKEGYNQELDRLIALSRNGKSWIAAFEIQEQERTGIGSLKVGFNKVYGYYIEVSKANLHLVPRDYIRKQTLVNGERYINESLKTMEEQVIGAEERRVALEYEIFEGIRERIARENERIKRAAALIAQVDVLAGLAEVADLYHYVRPEICDDTVIEIREGRHPVVERTVKDEQFVPNDIRMDGNEQQMLIITGPNMAGKSTLLRQTALTVLLAQMGSFVPAASAKIGLVDRIFTRVGASDDLAKGRSTFMVEMNETANILRHATPKSLVVLDEIGRGTSTYDGLSIAWAVAETLHDLQGKGVRTLFATHYHELTELPGTKPRVKNFNVAVREWNDRIIFLRKLVPGAASRSYGIQVARIAGVPEEVLERAREILENLEGEEVDEAGRPRLAQSPRGGEKEAWIQYSLFGMQDQRLIEWIRSLDISSMTPLQALVELSRLKEHVDSEN